MSLSKSLLILALSALAAVALPAAGQNMERPWESAAPWVTVNGEKVPDGGMPRYIRPETPEERKERLGIDEDPGINPDPKTEFRRFGKDFSIHRFDKKWVHYTDRPGWLRPHPNVNITEELYQENEKWVWVWVEKNAPTRSTSEERARATKYSKIEPESVAYLEKLRSDFEPLEPPKGSKKIRFEEASKGLPVGGSFRNSLAVADMNGDGKMDLVVPSERGSRSGAASIYLGDGKGNWKEWSIKWPTRLDYGSVVAADFNHDKKMDLAFGVHMKGVVILLGDGKGGFRVTKREDKFPTRRVIASDVNNDGWMDVVAIFEGPIVRDKKLVGEGYHYLRAYMNRKKGQEWEGMNVSGPKEGISGDWLVAANLNGDKHPDFIGSSLYHNATHTHYLSGERNYSPYFDESALVIPGRGVYQAVTAGRFSSRTRDDSIVASIRSWPKNADPQILPPAPIPSVVSLDRISFTGETPVRTPVMRLADDSPILGLNRGDFDGDGNDDLIFTRSNPRSAVVLLGDGKGGFSQAEIEGLSVAAQKNYDISVADVNGDKRPDVILMYETDSATALAPKNGSVQVFLNRGGA